MCTPFPAEPKPEKVIADMLKRDLNVTVSPEALALFIKHRWSRLAAAAHRIHESDGGIVDPAMFKGA